MQLNSRNMTAMLALAAAALPASALAQASASDLMAMSVGELRGEIGNRYDAALALTRETGTVSADDPRFLWMWPAARISVMGGNQASSVLATVKRDQYEAAGQEWSAEDEEAFKAPTRQQYEDQGSPYYSTARLWDDGVIDPADTRTVLGLALDVVARTPLPETSFGLFRM